MKAEGWERGERGGKGKVIGEKSKGKGRRDEETAEGKEKEINKAEIEG